MEKDKTLYDMFKRKFNGFALGYVIEDQVTPENNGHVKYFRFSIRQKRWLDREIYGIVSTFKNDKTEEDTGNSNNFDTVGFDAFELEKGFDLIIDVTKQGEFLNYDYKFARKASAIECNIEVLEAEILEIDFDKHITSSSDEDSLNFYRTVVLNSDEVDDIPESGRVEQEEISVEEPSGISDVNAEVSIEQSDDDVLSADDLTSILDEINEAVNEEGKEASASE